MSADEVMFYNQVVALPMSMLIIQARLQNRYYRQVQAVQSDAQLIVSNAKTFNGSGSSIARQAQGRSPANTLGCTEWADQFSLTREEETLLLFCQLCMRQKLTPCKPNQRHAARKLCDCRNPTYRPSHDPTVCLGEPKQKDVRLLELYVVSHAALQLLTSVSISKAV